MDDTDWKESSWWSMDAKEIATGYCINCDKIVDIEYCPISVFPGSNPACTECDSHNVEFMSSVIEHLIEKIEKLTE